MIGKHTLPLAVGLAFGIGLTARAEAVVFNSLDSLHRGAVSVCLGTCDFQNGQFIGGDLNETIPILIGEDGGFSAEFGPLGDVSFTWTMKSLAVSGNIDPVQFIGLAATDFGAPSSFGVLLEMPLTPIFGPAAWSTEFAAECTDVNSLGGNGPGDGCSLSPWATPPDLGSYAVSGLTIPGAAHPGGPLVHTGTAGAQTTGSFGPFTAAGAFDCTLVGGCTSFSTLLTFTGSGGGDELSLSTTLRIDPVQVPESATGALLGLGLIGLGLFRHRWNS